jgi:hypothetical protein
MSSAGNRFLGSYVTFVRRFIVGYLLLCSIGLLALLVADAVFPKAQIYGCLRDLILAHMPPAGTASNP